MANAGGSRPSGALRFVLPTLVLCAATLSLLVVIMVAGSPGGLAGALLPVAGLVCAAAIIAAFAMRAKIEHGLLAPIQRVEQAIRSVPDAGPVALAGVQQPGQLQTLVREASALLEKGWQAPEADERGSRETHAKTRLETVLRDLHDGVLICTLDHQVLLYNRRAIQLLKIPEGVGLDRPLFEVLAPRTFRHALTRLKGRLRHGRHAEHEDGLSVLMMAGTVDGRTIIKGRMSLMLDDAGTDPVGYVVTFDEVTNSLSQALWRERSLFDLHDDLKRRFEALTGHNDADVMAAEIRDMAEELDRLDTLLLDVLGSAWPMSAVFSHTLFECVQERNSEERGLTFDVEGDPVWLHCDSAAISDLLDRLGNRLSVHCGLDYFRLIATIAQDGEGYIDLMFAAPPIEQDLLAEWLDEPLEPDLGAVTGQDILHRHRTDVSVAAINDRVSRLRMPLRLAAERYERTERSYMPAQARAEFYDFDLLNRPHAAELDQTPLTALTCVVFDLETTGLEPSKGDEIISVGAARIVNGRLLRGEIFNEFVNPGRSIPAASTKIHGITDAMVADAPSPVETLPRFHRYVGRAALIAHNAAFDMKFLSMKEQALGKRFEQPVLDTLLLAAHALGRDGSLSLDGLSERFGITLSDEDRHTALGDALATGEVFLKLLPILETKGVRTLGDALAASNRQVGLRRMQEQF
ncbi:MAG: exonuclease domain-containing protein [Pseudomonadota bacterium]